MSRMTARPEDVEREASRSLALAEELVAATLSAERQAALDRLGRDYEQHRRALA